MPVFTFKLDAPEDFTPSLHCLNAQDTRTVLMLYF